MLEPGQTADRPSKALNLFLILLISLNVVAIILESVDWIYQQYQSLRKLPLF